MIDEPRVEDGVIVFRLRVNMCLKGLTLEQVDPSPLSLPLGHTRAAHWSRPGLTLLIYASPRLEQMVERRKELHLAMMANLHEELSLETDAKHREVRRHMSSEGTNEGLQLGAQKKCSHRF